MILVAPPTAYATPGCYAPALQSTWSGASIDRLFCRTRHSNNGGQKWPGILYSGPRSSLRFEPYLQRCLAHVEFTSSTAHHRGNYQFSLATADCKDSSSSPRLHQTGTKHGLNLHSMRRSLESTIVPQNSRPDDHAAQADATYDPLLSLMRAWTGRTTKEQRVARV